MTAKRVLIIDDTAKVRDTVKDVLFDFDCVFDEAASGAEALKLLAITNPDVIVLDVKLPDISGYEVIRITRNRAKITDKIIVITGFPDEESRLQALELNAFHFLTKMPLEYKELRAAFRAALDLPPETAPISAALARQRRIGMARRAPPRRRRHGTEPRWHLLVLDDQPAQLTTIVDALKDEFDLTLTTSPYEALRHVRRTRFDLVILDMKLPETNGIEVLEKMRRSRRDLRAIMLAADPDFDDAFRSAKIALAYLPKAKLDSLPAVIRDVLAREPPAQVFLSYDLKDRTKVSHLYAKLVAAGHTPWMDCKSIVGGLPWRPEIEKAIAHCDCFVFCATRRSVEKPGVVQAEVNKALERANEMPPGQNFFITLRLERCDIPAEYAKYQFVDYFERSGFDDLLRALNHNQQNKSRSNSGTPKNSRPRR